MFPSCRNPVTLVFICTGSAAFPLFLLQASSAHTSAEYDKTVCMLLMLGADINAQTDETQETALTLACCGGFLEVADFLIKAAADIELGCSTPLMEAAQEGHLELVKYLLKAGVYTVLDWLISCSDAVTVEFIC